MKLRAYNSEKVARRCSDYAGHYVVYRQNNMFIEGYDLVKLILTDPDLVHVRSLVAAEVMYEIIRLTEVGSMASNCFLTDIGDALVERDEGTL